MALIGGTRIIRIQKKKQFNHGGHGICQGQSRIYVNVSGDSPAVILGTVPFGSRRHKKKKLLLATEITEGTEVESRPKRFSPGKRCEASPVGGDSPPKIVFVSSFL
jgi:hypothetical protein